MNNTSAYANVLLKPSVAAPVVAAPKRDYQDDFSSADFHQTLKNLHDSQKSQDDKVYKPANPKKSTQVEHHHEAKNAKAVKEAKATNQTVAKHKTADNSADTNQNSIGREVVRKQPLQHKNKDISEDKSSNGESAQEVTSLVTDINPDASQNTLVALNTPSAVDIGVIQSSLVVSTELAPTAEPTSMQEDALSNDQATSIPLVKPVTEMPLAANAIALETESSANALPTPDASAEKSGEVVSLPLAVNESLIEKNLSQPLADNLIAISANQLTNTTTPAEAQVAAANIMASAAPVKPLQPQVALAEMSEVSDEVIDLLTPVVTEVSTSAKLASASNQVPTSNTVNPEVTTAQAQMNASKAAFEKTLQSIVSPDASGADDIATPLPNSSSTSSATNPLMDSLMRGADQPTPAARSFVVQTTVPVPVGQPQWSQAVGERVLWLAAQNVSSAEINLHPKDLGPMQVRVSVNQEQTTVSFTSQHAVVREVLDQNLNRLRDMFSEQGLNLVNVDVSDKSFSRQQGDTKDQKGQGGANDVAQDEETVVAMSAIVQQRLVDHYA
jgi:flagellar hook-length control protein FliK